MNTVKVNGLVESIKAGVEVEENWRDLFSELKKHRNKIINSYSRELNNIASTEDVAALYDDCLLSTVGTWTVNKHKEFFKYFSASLSKSKASEFRYAFRDKRVLAVKHTVSGDEVLSGDTSTTIYDMQEDETAIDQYSAVESAIDMKQVFDLYQNSNPKKRTENRMILEVVLANAGNETADYKEELLAVMPENTTWNYARQKLNRAKTDFKEFYKEISEFL